MFDFNFKVDNWERLSYVATVLTFFTTIVGFLFLYIQIKQARMNADLDGIQKFFEGITQRESAFCSAKGTDEKDKSFNELINFFEVYALAVNKKLLPKSSQKLVTDKLIESIALIHSSPYWKQKYEDAKLTKETFVEIETFSKKHRPRMTLLSVFSSWMAAFAAMRRLL